MLPFHKKRVMLRLTILVVVDVLPCFPRSYEAGSYKVSAKGGGKTCVTDFCSVIEEGTNFGGKCGR